jgi:hypothetical protein
MYIWTLTLECTGIHVMTKMSNWTIKSLVVDVGNLNVYFMFGVRNKYFFLNNVLPQQGSVIQAS